MNLFSCIFWFDLVLFCGIVFPPYFVSCIILLTPNLFNCNFLLPHSLSSCIFVSFSRSTNIFSKIYIGEVVSLPGALIAFACFWITGKIGSNGIYMSEAGKLKCKKICHLNVGHNSRDIKEDIKACLKEAENCQLKSISFPALGTGISSFKMFGFKEWFTLTTFQILQLW